MKNLVVLFGLLALVVIGLAVFLPRFQFNTSTPFPGENNQSRTVTGGSSELTTVAADNLEVPWALAFLPDESLLVTERAGRVVLVKDGQQREVATVSDVLQTGESGLHGIALHPDFDSNRYVYLYHTYSGSGNNTLNRVIRVKYEDEKFSDQTTVVDGIPGAVNHDGGRIKFGPDRMLYITTGDAQEPSLAQDRNSLAGKILRVTDEGRPAPGNPFNNEVYSYGHRNPQGITWDNSGALWETEHGPSGAQSGSDEINKIAAGKNYGWPQIQGDQSQNDMETPVINSGTQDTWAPGGAAFLNGSIFFTGLRGQALYEFEIDGSNRDLKKHFDGELGRIRDVVVGPDNMLYITTSNRDGRGSPQQGDDKILRVDSSKL